MSKNAALQALDILIVDDEADIRELVAGILSDEGYSTRLAGDSDGALRETRSRRISTMFRILPKINKGASPICCRCICQKPCRRRSRLHHL